jgi:hypothetical protein
MTFGPAEARVSVRTLTAENPADVPAVPPVPTERVPVPFEGEGSGTAPMTWGQTEIWQTMSLKGWLSVGGRLPLAPGATIEGVAEELRFMTSRFPSMRTRFSFDENDVPGQVLSASGETVLEVFDADDPEGAEALALEVEVHYRTATRDMENEWPVRMAVIRAAGVPTHMVVFSCHLVTDGAGAQIIARDMAARDTPPPPGTEQLDLARWQQSEDGQRRSAAVLMYWEKTLQALEPRPFPPSGARQELRHWMGEYSSPALKLATQAIAVRTKASTSSVLLALYAIALGRCGVASPAVIRPQASNRFRRGLTSMVANLVQAGLCVVETVDSTVDEVVARAKREAMAAFKSAYHDPAGLAALLARDAERRGPGAVPWDGYSWACLNDRGVDNQEPDAEPITPERLEAALALSTFRWEMKKENPFEPLYLHISAPGDAIDIMICADTDRLAPDDIEGLVRDIEALAVAAAFDAEVPTGVS